jgi:hypothetical protein
VILKITASSMRVVQGIALVTRWTTRNIAHNVVKNLHLAGTMYSKVQCNQIQPLVFSRFSSYLPSNGDDISGDAAVDVEVTKEPPLGTVAVSSTGTQSHIIHSRPACFSLHSKVYKWYSSASGQHPLSTHSQPPSRSGRLSYTLAR